MTATIRRQSAHPPLGTRTPARNEDFFDEGQLLRKSSALHGIPGTIVQGRYDCCTPPVSAWDLHKAWPDSRMVVSPAAGHSAFEPQNASALVEATDGFR